MNSIRAQKILLQIISSFYLIASLIAIAAGIILFLNFDKLLSNKYLPTDFAPTTTDFPIYLIFYILIIGTLMAILSIFGIYNVAKENSGQVGAYGIIHVVLLILNVIALLNNFQFSTLFSIFISATAVCLSFELQESFKNKRSNPIDSV